MKVFHRTAFQAAAAACVLAAGSTLAIHADDPPQAKTEKPAPEVDRVLDLNALAIPVNLAADGAVAGDGLHFMVGHTTDEAWVARVAQDNPRTPAASNGMVVVGSGRASSVYGYDVATGKRKWTTSSKDSGISNIVISLGHAYYTTYSCTLERVRVSDGANTYSKWLASTVDCAPDVKDQLVATSYRSKSTWEVTLHDAEQGSAKWSTDVGAQGVLTTPVIMDDNVFITSADGNLTRLESKKGKKQWSASVGAVSAPVATPWGLLVATTWDGKGADGIKESSMKERRHSERETVTDAEPDAPTLVAAKDRRIALVEKPSVKPSGKAAALAGPRSTLDFQGLRPGVSHANVFFAYAGCVVCVDPLLGKARWSLKLADADVEFTRPVAWRGLVLLAGSNGLVCALEEHTGALIWAYNFKGMRFMAEPAADDDQLFLTTSTGQLICLPTGADGREPRKAGVVGDAGVEGTAGAYWKVQQTFQRVRDIVRNVEPEPEQPPQPAPDARNNNGPGNGTPNNGPANENAAPPRRDEEVEELTKGQWERREDRKAERAKANGEKYEKKPFKRN